MPTNKAPSRKKRLPPFARSDASGPAQTISTGEGRTRPTTIRPSGGVHAAQTESPSDATPSRPRWPSVRTFRRASGSVADRSVPSPSTLTSRISPDVRPATRYRRPSRRVRETAPPKGDCRVVPGDSRRRRRGRGRQRCSDGDEAGRSHAWVPSAFMTPRSWKPSRGGEMLLPQTGQANGPAGVAPGATWPTSNLPQKGHAS